MDRIFVSTGKEVQGQKPFSFDLSYQNLDTPEGELYPAAHHPGNQYRSLFTNNPDPVFVLDRHGRFLEVNSAAECLIGQTQSQLRGQSFVDFCLEEEKAKALTFLARGLDGKSVTTELQGRFRGGAVLVLQVSAAPICHEERVTGLFCIARNRTSDKEIENRLRNNCRNAEQAKDRFLAVLSHELRTPLMPVLTTVQMLQTQENLSSEMRDSLAMMRRNLELETRLIDDLLDLNRLRHGTLMLYVRNTNVHTKIRHVLGLCQTDLAEKKITLEVHLNATPCEIAADPARIQQILWNMIGNAVKFTPEGGTISIQTSISSMPNHPQQHALLVQVTDTGIGMDSQELSRVFSGFERDDHEGRRFGGAGIGLSISRALTHRHSGHLLAHSEGRGKGSTFTLLLPLRHSSILDCHAGKEPPVSPASRKTTHILLVEDHGDTAKVLARLLRSKGFKVTVSASLNAAIRAAQEHNFHLLISDIGLPDGTGLDVLHFLHQRQHIPAIALSGFGMEDDIRRSREAGFDEHLVKPIDIQQLQQIIDRLLPVTPAQEAPDKPN